MPVPDARSQWWRLKGDASARSLWGWAERLRSRQRAEALLDRLHEAIYEGRPVGAAGDHPALRHMVQTNSAPANLNVARSMVDTVAARLTKRRPQPVITADDAEWAEKLYAKKASRVIRRKTGGRVIERMRPDVLRSCIVRGTGVTKVFREGGDVALEEIPRSEVLADPVESRYGKPRTMAVVKNVNRDVLAEAFPERRREILNAQRQSRDEWSFYDEEGWGSWDSDMLRVVEAWHLPSGKTAKDGKHLIAIEGTWVCEEPWTRPRFPLAFMHWSAPIRGIHGHGLIEDLVGIQAKINDVARDFQEGLYWAGALKIFTPRQSNIVKAHLRARQPAVVEHDGAMPQYAAPASVFAQYLEYLEWLIRKAYEISGISQLAASSKSPLGSNASGKALDTMMDIESDRFAPVELGQALWICDVAQLMIDEARAISEDEEYDCDPASWIQDIDWTRVDVDNGDYHLTVEPINFLPDTRAGKLAYVGELAKAGLLQGGAVQTLALFDEPDIARANRHLLGPIRNIERAMDGVADVTIPLADVHADPHWKLDLCMEIGLGELNYAMSDGADEDVIERYREWISNVEGLIRKKSQGEAAMAPPPGGPMGTPAPPPAPPEMGLSVPGLAPAMAA